MQKILTVFGTRPEAIKMAPLIKALQNDKNFLVKVVVTAQHRQMLDQVLELFAIVPDYDLNIMRATQSLTGITKRCLIGLEEIIHAESPDLMLVHGDTTTTFSASLAAFYQKVPIGHVEAGLRTADKYCPYPEEMNRRLTGAIAELHFAPTEIARANLLKENVATEKIFVTGNTVIDALLQTSKKNYPIEELLPNVDWNKRIILLTAHRRENWGSPLKDIFIAARKLIANFQDTELIFPVHRNPAIALVAQEILGGRDRIHLIEPLSYLPFVALMNKSYLILTDSGGMQEEAPSLGKPVLVLREFTERPEAVVAGTVKVVGSRQEQIYEAGAGLLEDAACYKKMSQAVNPYGDGHASEKIIIAIKKYNTKIN